MVARKLSHAIKGIPPLLCLLVCSGAFAEYSPFKHDKKGDIIIVRAATLHAAPKEDDWKPKFQSLKELTDFIKDLGFRVVWQGTAPHHYAALFDTGDGRLGEMVYSTDPADYDGASQGVNTSHGCPLAGESQLYVKYKFADFTESKEQAEGHTTVAYRGATGLFLVGDIYRLDPGFKGKFQVDYTARDSRSGKPDVPVIKATVQWPLKKVAPTPGPATGANPAATS